MRDQLHGDRDSNGTTLLRTVTATTTAIRSGGIAFRATGHDKFWDTVTDTPGVNNFAAPATVAATVAVWKGYSPATLPWPRQP